MNDKEKNQVLNFLGQDKHIFADLLMLLFNDLSLQFNFKLKIQKASIQLIHTLPFAVLGFRKSKDYCFLEFYSASEIDNSRIVKKTKHNDRLIIHTVNLLPDSNIDDNILTWIKNSYELTTKTADYISPDK